jgi:rod shape-determining protein MreC
MDWRSSWLRERKSFVHTVAAVVLAVALLASGRTVSSAIGNFVTPPFYYPFQKIKQVIGRMTQTAGENEALKTTVVELSNRLQFYNEIRAENERLRAMLGFIERAEYTVVPAEIISVIGSGIPNRVVINLGAADSIRENQTVINRNGVAGRVARVMDNYSVVYLLTEPRCRVAARIKRSREEGIIRYDISRSMYLDNCPQKSDVAVGDTVITSGMGGIFPEGLVIGTVHRIETPEKEFFYDISVDPAVNFNGLDELYILKRKE